MTQSTTQIVATRYRAPQRVSEIVLSDDQRSVQQGECDLDDAALSALIRFFEVLDRWDREAKRNAKVL